MQQLVGTIASSSSDARLQKIKLILPSSSQGGEEGKKLISPLDWGGEGKTAIFLSLFSAATHSTFVGGAP